MLTADLLRTKIRRQNVIPAYIDPNSPEYLEIAEIFINIFRSHIGKTRKELNEALSEYIEGSLDYILYRGLVKLLEDRAEFSTNSPIDPPIAREKLFKYAAITHKEGRFNRVEVIRNVANNLNITPSDLELSIYADLKDFQHLVKFDEVTPQWLLNRYNTALAQAVLYRAINLNIYIEEETPSKFRQLFRYIKFFRLLYHAERTIVNRGYKITLDGPMSIFQSSQKYGIQLAQFLPALLLCKNWTLEANLLWGKRGFRKIFSLDWKFGLKSHYHDFGIWIPEEFKLFEEQFNKLNSEWKISSSADLIELGGEGVLVPDYKFEHVKTGKIVFLDILGYWRKRQIEKYLRLIKKYGHNNLIIAISKSFNVDEENLDKISAQIYLFKSVISPKEILNMLKVWDT